jgi:KR domain
MQLDTQVTGAAACTLPDMAAEHTALLSSTAAVWSQAGAAHYAAGNAFLDATAAATMAAGLPTTAINFGPFRSVPAVLAGGKAGFLNGSDQLDHTKCRTGILGTTCHHELQLEAACSFAGPVSRTASLTHCICKISLFGC